MTSLSVSPEDAEGTALGVTVSELQEGISITGTKISGTLNYKKGFEAFDKTDNSGNFLVLKVEYPEDAEVKFTLEGGSTRDKKFPKGDHQLVVKVKDASSQKLKIDITKGGKTGSVTYDLSGLTLKPDGSI